MSKLLGLFTGGSSAIAGYAIAALVVVGMCAGAFYEGTNVQADHDQAKQVTAINQAVADAQAEGAKQTAAAVEFEKQQEQAHVVYQTITKQVDRIVDRPVYRNVCLDTDGLRLVNAALAGVSSADSTGSDGAVPGPDAHDGRDGSGGPSQVGGSGSGVPDLPATPSGAR